MMRNYRWAVIGAGPAGIAAVGSLLDHGVVGNEIIWIDPQFAVGDFGSRWKNIPSNTKVQLFQKFLHASDAFLYTTCDKSFQLNHTPSDHTCLLGLMVEPLQWVTHQLQAKVAIKKDFVKSLSRHYSWNLKLRGEIVVADNVVLAIGAEPKTLTLSSCPMIHL